MKKTSIASFIIAIILVVASIALFVLGFLSVNTTQVYSKVGNGYSFMKVSYSLSLNNIIKGLFFVLLGGVIFIGGILMFVLAAVTRLHTTNCVKDKANTSIGCSSTATQTQPQSQNVQGCCAKATSCTEPSTVEISCAEPSKPESEN